jgi:hypothetical protein
MIFFIINYILTSLLYYEIQKINLKQVKTISRKVNIKERNKSLEISNKIANNKKYFLVWPALIVLDIYNDRKK